MASPRRQQQQQQGSQVPDLGSLLQLFSLFQPNAAQQGEQQIQQQHLGLQQQQVTNDAQHQKTEDYFKQLMLQLQQQQADSADRHQQAMEALQQGNLKLGERQVSNEEGRNNIASMDSAAKTAMDAATLQSKQEESKLLHEQAMKELETKMRVEYAKTLTGVPGAEKLIPDVLSRGQVAVDEHLAGQKAAAQKQIDLHINNAKAVVGKNTKLALQELITAGKSPEEAQQAVTEMLKQQKPSTPARPKDTSFTDFLWNVFGPVTPTPAPASIGARPNLPSFIP